MYTLSRELMSSIYPSPSYLVFLYEQTTLFKLKSLKEMVIPYQLKLSVQFLETFVERIFTEHNMLCQHYLHDMACTMDPCSNLVRYLGDVQFRTFASFVNNHVQWENDFIQSLRMRPIQICGLGVNLNLLGFSLHSMEGGSHLLRRLNS